MLSAFSIFFNDISTNPTFNIAIILFQLLNLALIIFAIVMFFDCLKRDFRSNWEKIIWLLAMVFGTSIAALAYCFAIRWKNPQGILKG